MPSLSSITRGTRARHPATTTLLDGGEASLALRPLAGLDDALVLERAAEFARSRNAEPKPGDPLYELGLQVHTLLLAALDSDAGSDAPFFDGGQDQLLAYLDSDRISLLYEKQRLLQNEVSPRKGAMGEREFWEKVLEIAGGGDEDDRPFVSLQPALLRSFTRTLARLHLSSLGLKSLYGENSTEAAAKSTEPNSEPVIQ